MVEVCLRGTQIVRNKEMHFCHYCFIFSRAYNKKNQEKNPRKSQNILSNTCLSQFVIKIPHNMVNDV